MPTASQSYKTLIYLDPNEGLLKYKRLSDGASFPLPFIQNNTFKLREKDIFPIANSTEYDIVQIPTNDGIPTFRIQDKKSPPQFVRGGGGKSTSSGIIVQDEDISLIGRIETLNFEGAGVIVTADGNGKATVTIGGGGMLFGVGTPDRLAMFTAPNTLGDSPFLRSGSDVIADGFMYFMSGNGIDVVASGGVDILNIGATNADVINYGYAGTTHNFNGTVFNVFTTNLNVTDKIITLNDGGAAGSGGNVGFEIEEGGLATGYFIQNTTRDGFDFQASAVTGVATFDLSGLTGNQTATLQDASGTIAYLSDIPAPLDAFVQNGNSFGAPAVLGTNDAFSLSFETTGATRGTIGATGLWGINASPVAGTLLYVQGTGTTSATYILELANSTPTVYFQFRDDGAFVLPVDGQSIIWNGGSRFEKTVGEDISFVPNGSGSFRGYNATMTRVILGYDNRASTNSVAYVGARFYDGDEAFAVNGNGTSTFIQKWFASSGGFRACLTDSGNFGLGTQTFGTNAFGVIAMVNNSAPTSSPANTIQIFSKDSTDGTPAATLGLFLEQPTEAIGTFTATDKIRVWINNLEYWIQLDAVI